MSAKDLGAFVSLRLEELNMSQADLSRKTGISTSQISKIVLGSPGSLDTLVDVARGLGIAPGVLLDVFAGDSDFGNNAVLVG